MAGKQHQEEEEHKSEAAGMMRWLLTYADMITLLLAFFIVIVGASKISTAKYNILAAQAARVFGGGAQVFFQGEGSPRIGGKGVLPFPAKKNIPPPPEGEKGPGKGVETIETPLGMLIPFDEREGRQILFDSGQAALKSEALQIIDSNFEYARKKMQAKGQPDFCVLVEGFTDKHPINSIQFPSNWELSTARAASVAKHLLAKYSDISPDRTSIAGYGENLPLPMTPGETSSDYDRKNRRVLLWLLNNDTCKVMKQFRVTANKAMSSTTSDFNVR